MKKFLLKAKKILYKAIPFVVALILFCYSGTGASAAYNVIDYQDYITDVTYNGDNKIVQTTFSWQLNYIQLSQNGKNLKYDYGTYNFVCDWDLLEKDSITGLYDFSVVTMPIGERIIKLSNFPKDTEFTFTYRIEENRGNQVSCHLVVQFQWYGENQEYIGHTTAYEEVATITDSKIFSINTPLKILTPADVHYFRVRVSMDMIADGNQTMDSFSIYPSSLYMDIPLSSLMVQEAQNEKIISELEKLNEYNEDLINGTPEQNEKVDAAVGELDSAGDRLGNLTEDMKVDKPDLSDVDVSPDALVSPIDRATLTAPLVKLWENPTILGMITIVFVLILVSWVFFGKKD